MGGDFFGGYKSILSGSISVRSFDRNIKIDGKQLGKMEKLRAVIVYLFFTEKNSIVDC